MIENRKNERIRAVFEHVSSDLSSWIDGNRVLDTTGEGVQEPLVSAIDGTRYASTVHAAVRRYGDWYNLDYYHHLAFGVRKLAVAQIGRKAEEFRVIVDNLARNDALSAARQFSKRVLTRLEDAIDQSYKRIQTDGRETFQRALAEDIEFWGKCEQRWGRGKIDGMGYRSSIRDMTDERLRSSYDEAHQTVFKLIEEEWARIITLLEGMLRETDVARKKS